MNIPVLQKPENLLISWASSSFSRSTLPRPGG